MNQSTNQLIQLNQPINLSTKFWLKIGLLAGVFLFAYGSVIPLLVRTWSGRDDYSHGFLIPFISLYLVWYKREKLKNISVQPNIPGGLILTLAGSLMLITGRVSSTVIIQQLSIIVIMPGLILMVFGMKYLKALFLPLAYLILMVPIFDFFINNVHWPFQLFSATIAAKLLKIINIPVFQNANYLELPNITLEVANACSGVRYLISIIAIGIPLAIFTQRKWRQRVLLVTLAVMVGILANPIRITLVGIWTYYTGKDIHGPFHVFQGLFVSGGGFIFLFIGAWVLHKVTSSSTGKDFYKIERATADNFGSTKKMNRACFMSIMILLCLGGYLYLFKPGPVYLKTSLNKLPLSIGEWKSENINDYEKPFPIQGADFETARVYRNDSGREIKLQISYFELQQQDKELIHYTLQKLYENTEEIAIQKNSRYVIRVNKTLLRDGPQNSLILYWYDLNGRIIADKYKAKFITAIDGLIYKRTNGAIIMISSTWVDPDNMQRALNDETEFIRVILPVLDNYLP